MLPDDICPRPERLGKQPTEPLAPALYSTAVWMCNDTEQVAKLLAGEQPGYVYQRDSHPNADLLAEKCRDLHSAECVAITSSGMSALSLALLTQVNSGEHLVLSKMLYGRSLLLLTQEASRLGIEATVVDTCDHAAVRAAIRPNTRLIVVETIANPRLEVADIAQLSQLAHQAGASLLVDNTFATPLLCKPLELGADLVHESVTKMMNGHSDVTLGLLAGHKELWSRVPSVSSTWGLTSSPFDCWMACRGLMTMHLRVERACDNALRAAQFLSEHPQVEHVDYPGLKSHPQHSLASRQFVGRFGTMVTFHLRGGLKAANAFIAGARRIPFCPSLGDVSTTLSHPEWTSHRGLSKEARQELGITGGTIRLSVGIESSEHVVSALAEGLAQL